MASTAANTFVIISKTKIMEQLKGNPNIIISKKITKPLKYDPDYTFGSDVLHSSFSEKDVKGKGGFVYTNKYNILAHHALACDPGDNGGWVTVVKIPPDAKIVDMYPTYAFAPQWKTDKIILCKQYPLYDVNTIIDLNIVVTPEYVDGICKYGKVDILQWLMKNKIPFKYSQKALAIASEHGHVNILDWWLKSGLPFKYDHTAIDYASSECQIGVLNWWLKSGLPLKYSENAIDVASYKCHIDVLNWWLNSGLELKYSNWPIHNASAGANIDILNWWKNSGLPLKYNTYALNYAGFAYPMIGNEYVFNRSVFDWWVSSGLELKYDGDSMDWASHKGYVEVLQWWKESGLPLKYSEKALAKELSKCDQYSYNNVLQWWKNSGLPLKYSLNTQKQLFDKTYFAVEGNNDIIFKITQNP